MSEFPEQLAHDDIIEIMPDIFHVRGLIRFDMTPQPDFSRNMFVIRDNEELTLVNTLRLDEKGLEKLDALGSVKHVVRLGAFHGRDDAFYLDRYNPTLWAVPDMPYTRGEQTDKLLIDGEAGPMLGSSAFVFDTPKMPEAILHIERHGGILFSCDSLQNRTEPDKYFNDVGTAFREKNATNFPAHIGPGFVNIGKPKREEFERLLTLDFEHLLTGHGAPIIDTARQAIKATIKREF